MMRFWRDRRGMAATEFALTVPILIILFVGCYQFSDALMLYRKMTRMTRTIADVTAQNTKLSAADVNSILQTSTQVMTPYDTSSVQMYVMQVKVDGSGNGKVDWAQSSSNTTPPVVGSTVTLPSTIGNTVKNGYLIVAKVNYTYVPKIVPAEFGSIPLADTSMMLPRASDSVQNTG